MYVCNCQGVNEQTVKRAIEQGAATVHDLKRCSGAATGCGQCVPRLNRLLEGRKSQCFGFTDGAATTG